MESQHRHHWIVDDNLTGHCQDCPDSRTFDIKARLSQPPDETPIGPDDYWAIARAVSRGRKDEDDVKQECFLALWEAKPTTKGLANAIARRQAIDYWRKVYGRTSGHVSIDQVIGVGENVTWADVLADPRQEQQLYARAALRLLPGPILHIVACKLAGQRLSGKEKVALHRWRRQQAL